MNILIMQIKYIFVTIDQILAFFKKLLIYLSIFYEVKRIKKNLYDILNIIILVKSEYNGH